MAIHSLTVKQIISRVRQVFPNAPETYIISLINDAFKHCYLNEPETSSKFISLINSDDGDYTRYLFFYFNNFSQIYFNINS